MIERFRAVNDKWFRSHNNCNNFKISVLQCTQRQDDTTLIPAVKCVNMILELPLQTMLYFKQFSGQEKVTSYKKITM